ncbi:MAG TPA: hypothetical protein VGK25_08500 [Ignavibacteria bacterium]
MYKKLIYSLAIVTLVTIAFLFNSCSDTPVVTPGIENPNNDAGNGCNTPNQFCGSPGTAFIQNTCPGTVTTIDLWAGVGNPDAGVLVGRVEFYPVSGTTWKVKYVFTNSSFEPTSIHFSIKCQLSDIPHTNNGNPIPGQFQYKFNAPFGSFYEFNITLPSGCTCFYVAAHAGGTLGGLDCFNVSIPPGCVTISNLHHAAAEGCYFTFNLSNAGNFNGSYCGWCMDLGTSVLDSNFNCAHMFSSLAPFPEYLKPSIEGWQDMDKINYLINTWQVGQSIQRKNYLCQNVDGSGVINTFDFQKAIWRILDLGPGSTYSELSDSLVVNALVCDMIANGEGFVPSCENGDLIVFFIDPGLNPNQTRAQPILTYAPCCDGQGVTAWGDGKYGGNFSGPNWATYFKWCPTCP